MSRTAWLLSALLVVGASCGGDDVDQRIDPIGDELMRASCGYCDPLGLWTIYRDGRDLQRIERLYPDTGDQQNRGRLSSQGEDELARVLDTVDPSMVDAFAHCIWVDVGWVTVWLESDAGPVELTYCSFNGPCHEELVEIDAFFSDVMAALQDCSTSEFVDVDADCAPLGT